jgi:predicted HD phosphohydrolase
MKLDFTKKNGETFEKVVPITKVEDEFIALTLLHEICHMVAGERYGYDSKQYGDEKLCDAFANRWLKVLKKEKLL